MILRLFSGDKPGSALIILIFGIILWLPAFFSHTPVGISSSGYLSFGGSLSSFAFGNPLLSRMIACLFLSFQAFLIVRLNVMYMLIQQKNYLPALFFISITSFYLPLMNFSGYIFSSFFFILILMLLFSVYKKEPNSYRFFEAGLVLGIGSLFYPRLIYFLPFIWIVSIILRPFYWREWVLPVIGMILPYIFIVAYLYLTNNNILNVFISLWMELTSISFTFKLEWNYLVIAGFIFFLIVIASLYMLRVFQFRKIYIRNYYLSFFWLFFISLVAFFFLSHFDPGILYVFALPVSFILSNYFKNSRPSLGNKIIFAIFIFIMIGNSLLNLYQILF
jgi:hypothetical protein